MFRLGGNCGLKPQEVLDLDLEQFNCFIQGYSDRTVELQQLAVEIGYWSAYYSNAKHPKPVAKVLEMLKKKSSTKTHSDQEPDVEAYLQLEQKRLEMLEGRDLHA